jgi:hypothetical protein
VVAAVRVHLLQLVDAGGLGLQRERQLVDRALAEGAGVEERESRLPIGIGADLRVEAGGFVEQCAVEQLALEAVAQNYRRERK